MPRYVALSTLEQFAAINLTSDPGYDPDDRHIPQVAKITLTWGLGSGKVGHNVLHGRYAGPYIGSQAQANAIFSGLTTSPTWAALASHLATSTFLHSVQLRDLNVEDLPEVSSVLPLAPGTSTGSELPNEVAFVITFRTAFSGRQNRGRMYIPGWATTALGAGNTVNAAAVDAATDWAEIIAGVLQSQGYTFGIGHYSRKAYPGANGANHPARPPGLVPITSVEARDNHWDTQRKRGLD